MELAKDSEFVQLLVVDRDADATGRLGNYNNWARGRCGVLDEARGEEFVQNRVHLLGSRRIDVVEPRHDGRAVRRNRNVEGKQRAGAEAC